MVTQAKPRREWELKNSAYILLGLFPWLDAFAFVYIGKKTGRKQWIRQGIIFGSLWYFWTAFLIMTDTYSYMIKGTFVRQIVFMVKLAIPFLWPFMMILLLASRKDYLRLLFWTEKQPQNPQLMCEKGWIRKHSLWTIWSFLPGFGGISFLIGGYELKNRTWKKIGWAVTAVGILAAALLNSMSSFAQGLPYSTHNCISKLSLATLIMIFPLQIALMLGLRREYLEHEAVIWETKQQRYECLSSLNWRIKNSWWILLCMTPYCGGAGLIAAGLNSKKKNWAVSGLLAEILITFCAVLSRVIPSTNENRMVTGVIGIVYNLIMLAVFAMACIIRNEYLFIRAKKLGGSETEIQQEIEMQEKLRKRMKEKKPVLKADVSEKTDINTCTEEELGRLPGITLAQVKIAMEYRKKNGFFNSVDDFVNILGFKPHFAVQIFEKVTANPIAISKKNTGEKTVRRTIDI